MIIENEADLTRAVLAEAQHTPDPRLRELIAAAVRHLHGFVRETRLTEAEFRQICGLIARAGQLTTPSHNEVVLAAGSLGVSALVCLLNNGGQEERGTTANLMGPFWRQGAPEMPQGASIVRSPTPGDPVFVTARIQDAEGVPLADAQVDVWQASGEGYYENQDPEQADMNLRGRFRTGTDGTVRFRTVKPSGYPIPVGGPVGQLIRAQGRHNMRPAHIHFMVHKPGWKTQFSQLYSSDDPHLETDVQFGVTRALVGRYVAHDGGNAPAPDVQGRWYSLEHTFVVAPGDDALPPPPITAKTDGPRPPLVKLQAASPHPNPPPNGRGWKTRSRRREEMISHEERQQAAMALFEAGRKVRPIPQVSKTWPQMEIEDSYVVQQLWAEQRVKAGARVIGHKIGLTSRAMQQASKMTEPDYGVLLDDMVYADGARIPAAQFAAPRLEVELAFVLGKRVGGRNVTMYDVLDATAYVTPALEIIDYRTEVPRAIVDTIADNAAAAGMVTGGRVVRPMDVDLRWCAATLSKNGVIEESGVSAAIMGHPAMGIVWLANRLARHDIMLEPGHILLAGSFTRPVNIAAGDVIHADFGPLGSIGVSFS